jgi:hypothetical protein
MNAIIDLDDADGLLAADRDGSLHAASMAGGQVRAVGVAVAEGALESLTSGERPRAVVWVGGRGTASTAGAVLAGALVDTASVPLVIAPRAPVWVGPLDVMVVTGHDAGDPVLSAAVEVGTRRGARVVIAAPEEGPLSDSGAGRAISLPPRLPVPDTFGLSRNLAVGLAVLDAVDHAVPTDLMATADEVDGEVSRNTVSREVFTNAAKALSIRLTSGSAVLCGDRPVTLALAQHGAATLLKLTQRTVTAAALADALSASRDALPGNRYSGESIFHDEYIDGPRADGPPRILALATDVDHLTVTAQLEGIDDTEVVGTTDPSGVATRPSELSQLMMLVVRLEMAAVYARLGAGSAR